MEYSILLFSTSQEEIVSDVTISTNQPKLKSLEKRVGKFRIQNCKKKLCFIVTTLVLVSIVVLVYIMHAKKGKFHVRLGEYIVQGNFFKLTKIIRLLYVLKITVIMYSSKMHIE